MAIREPRVGTNSQKVGGSGSFRAVKAGDGERDPRWRSLDAARSRGVAGIRRLASKGMSRIARIEERRGGGLAPATRALLALVFLLLVSVIDYQLFESLMNLPPVWTWVVTVSMNGVLLGFYHKVAPDALFDVLNTEEHLRRSAKWVGKCLIVAVIFVALLIFSVTAAWLRAKGFSVDTGIFGVIAPGFTVSFLLFMGLLLILFGGAVLLGFQDAHREDRIASGDYEPELSIRDRRRVMAIAQETLQACKEYADRVNAKLTDRASRMGPNAPDRIPVVEVPEEIVEYFDGVLERYGEASK